MMNRETLLKVSAITLNVKEPNTPVKGISTDWIHVTNKYKLLYKENSLNKDMAKLKVKG